MMAASVRTARDYENEIDDLKKQIRILEKSKIDMLINMGKEIDRLREYIKYLTHKNHKLNPFEVQNSIINSSDAYNIDFSYPPVEPQANIDAAINQINPISNPSSHSSTIRSVHSIHSLPSIHTTLSNHSSASHNTKASHNSRISHDSPIFHDSPKSSLEITNIILSPPTFTQPRRRKQTIGQIDDPSTSLVQKARSIVVNEADLTQATEMNLGLIEEMEGILNEYMTLQLFGVVECRCNEPKPLRFITRLNEDEDAINTTCNNCHQHYASLFKCDACSMRICSKCQTFIAEMQCLRAVMQHFIDTKQFEKQQNEENQAINMKSSYHFSPTFDYKDDLFPSN